MNSETVLVNYFLISFFNTFTCLFLSSYLFVTSEFVSYTCLESIIYQFYNNIFSLDLPHFINERREGGCMKNLVVRPQQGCH
jgi:hypothetical protein